MEQNLTFYLLRQGSHRAQFGANYFLSYIFICIFVNEKFCILIRITLKFVPKGLFDNMSALVQVKGWRITGDKPLPEPMVTQFTDAYMRHWVDMS